MEEKQNNVEVHDIKNLPEKTPENVLQTYDETALQSMVERGEKYLKFHDRIRKLSLNLTSVADWIDENGKPYLQWSGAAKIRKAFGIQYTSPELKEDVYKDDLGEVYQASYTGLIGVGDDMIAEVGTATSRDSLFGVRYRDKADGSGKEKYFLPLSEISRTDVKKKAMTNWLNRGIKSQIGLSFTWSEIEAITEGRITRSIVRELGGGVSYSSGSKGGQKKGDIDTEKKRARIAEMLMEMCGNNKESAALALQTYTAFEGKNGPVPGKSSPRDLSPKQIPVVYRKIEKEYNEMFGREGK